MRFWTPLVTHPGADGVEPFMKDGMDLFSLFLKPSTDWVQRCEDAIQTIEASQRQRAPGPSLASDITIVTTLLDLKRATQAGTDFKRTMEEYYARFNYILIRGFKMLVFMPIEFKQHLRIQDDRVTIVHFPSEDIANYFPYYDRVQAIRTSPLWTQQAKALGWLAASPQASLPGYDPLVMSKMFLLRDAVELNPYNSKYLLFVDSGHSCAGAQDPQYMDVYTSHMDRGFLVTHWPYGTNSEVHGMCDKAMHEYVGTQEDPLRIVRGGVFGGTPAQIEVVAKVYEIILAQSLSDGYMGTEENIFAIAFARFPKLFAGYDNNQWGIHGDNCAIFNHQSRRKDELVAAGK